MANACDEALEKCDPFLKWISATILVAMPFQTDAQASPEPTLLKVERSIP
jgi:hypothetical protein